MVSKVADLKVLVVEDSKVTLKAICNYLGRMGIQPLTAVTGKDALAIYRRERPDNVANRISSSSASWRNGFFTVCS